VERANKQNTAMCTYLHIWVYDGSLYGYGLSIMPWELWVWGTRKMFPVRWNFWSQSKLPPLTRRVSLVLWFDILLGFKLPYVEVIGYRVLLRSIGADCCMNGVRWYLSGWGNEQGCGLAGSALGEEAPALVFWSGRPALVLAVLRSAIHRLRLVVSVGLRCVLDSRSAWSATTPTSNTVIKSYRSVSSPRQT